jgi:hypothetical protein
MRDVVFFAVAMMVVVAITARITVLAIDMAK